LRWAFVCLSNFLHIGKVSDAAGSFFRRDQILLRDEVSCQTGSSVDNGVHTPFPRVIEFNTIDSRL